MRQPGRESGHAQTQAPTGQAEAEPITGARQPRQHRSLRAAHLPSRRLVGQTFQVTQDERGAQLRGEAVDLVVQDGAEFCPNECVGLRGPARLGHGLPRPLGAGAASSRSTGMGGHAAGNPVQPGRHRLALRDRRRLANERQKRGLKGILGIFRTAEAAATGLQHHRPVPPHQQLEGGFIATRDVTTQQLSVADGARRVLVDDAA